MPKRIILEGIITDKINNILLLLLFKKSENINDIPILWIVAAIIVPIVHVLLNTVLYAILAFVSSLITSVFPLEYTLYITKKIILPINALLAAIPSETPYSFILLNTIIIGNNEIIKLGINQRTDTGISSFKRVTSVSIVTNLLLGNNQLFSRFKSINLLLYLINKLLVKIYTPINHKKKYNI